METHHALRMSKEQILEAFQQLLNARKARGPRIATRQETAEREEDKRIVETASTYTVESIVKGLADLQLTFGQSLDSLAEQLAVEAPKLEELRRAIRVETQHLDELRHIRTAADALDILIQEHRETMRALEEDSRQKCQALEQEIAERRQVWQQEQEEFEATVSARQEAVKKEREQQEADYQYDLERQRKIETDEYASHKALLERRISLESAQKEVDWSEREQRLASQQELLQRYKAQAESFPAELEEAVRKAREEAMNEVYEDAKFEAELFEKEWQADKNVHELKIVALGKIIEDQTAQIEQLSGQLHASLQQVQDLASRAVGSTAHAERRG